MDRKSKFFICVKCANLMNAYQFSGNVPSCCNEKMENLAPMYDSEGMEKHLPYVVVDGARVKITVGADPHPMTDAHGISWIYLVTKFGDMRKYLLPGEEPAAVFTLEKGDIPIAAYAHCNMHGLWKTVINKGDCDCEE